MDLDATNICGLAAVIALGTVAGNLAVRRRLICGRGLSSQQRLTGGVYLGLDNLVQSAFLVTAILAAPRLNSVTGWVLAVTLLIPLAVAKVYLIDNRLERWRDRRLGRASN